MDQELTAAFLEAVKEHAFFQEAVDIATANSRNQLWIIGGFVFRNVASVLYGGVQLQSDIDFIVAERSQDIVVPSGWQVGQNRYGTPKLVNGDRCIDLPCLSEWHSIKRRQLTYTIDNVLTGSPLTVQSIVYDVRARQVLGPIGVAAIRSKTVAVSNAAQAAYYAERKEKLLATIIREKAADLGFQPIFD